MSVVIKGEQMPDNCAYCSCCNGDMGYCQVTGKDCFDNDYDYHRPDWCPLEEVDDD